jgi:hypothetical protein
LVANLIYVGLTADLAATFVDIDVETADPAVRARVLLAEHRSCDHIEFWQGDIRLCVIARVDPDVAA